MEAKKDYYKILGLTDEDKKLSDAEFKDKLKTRFRKLSLKWHPDKCRDESKKKEYTEKFQEINEAYDVLGDDNKRAQYDNPMNGAFSGGNPFSGMEDIFSAFGGNPFGGFGFDFGNQRQQKRVQKGSNLRISIGVTLEEVYNGGTKKLQYDRYDKCESCNGSGKTAQSREETCSVCGGTGRQYTVRGNLQQITTCPHCHGKGSFLRNPCPQCQGNGIKAKKNSIEVNIPKGVPDSAQMEWTGYGNAAPHGDGIYGDLLVVFKTLEHPIYTRRDNDLYMDINISAIDAILGCTVDVPTIDGKVLQASIKNGITDGSKVRFKGKGLPHFEDANKFGDLYGVIHITIPSEVDADEKALLEQLREKRHFKKQ